MYVFVTFMQVKNEGGCSYPSNMTALTIHGIWYDCNGSD